MMKREELSRIASVKFQKALSDRARAVTPRVLAFCVMAVSLVFTLAVTAANLRLTYVTDSDGARQLVVSSETDPARVMSLSGIEAEEGDNVYYTAFSGNLASLNIERAFAVSIQADGQEYSVKMAVGTVRNFCYPGTPYAFWERVRRAKAYMNRPDIAALFDDVKPSDFPAQLGVKLFLMQRRMAFAMCFLFTYVFDRV